MAKGKGGAGSSSGAGNTSSGAAEAVAPGPEREEEELPVIETLGLARVPAGWCVVVIHTQGLKIVDKEIEGAPSSRAVAFERLKLEVLRRFVAANGARARA